MATTISKNHGNGSGNDRYKDEDSSIQGPNISRNSIFWKEYCIVRKITPEPQRDGSAGSATSGNNLLRKVNEIRDPGMVLDAGEVENDFTGYDGGCEGSPPNETFKSSSRWCANTNSQRLIIETPSFPTIDTRIEESIPLKVSFRIQSHKDSFLGGGLHSMVYSGDLIIQNSEYVGRSCEEEGRKYGAPRKVAAKVFLRDCESMQSFSNEFLALYALSRGHKNISNMICASFPPGIGMGDYIDVKGYISPNEREFAEELYLLEREPPVEAIRRSVIFFDYCGKMTLHDWIANQGYTTGKELWLKWAEQLSSALSFMHCMGVIHHDIKPHNIIVSDDLSLKLVDFGSSCIASVSKSAKLMGSLPIVGSNLSNDTDMYSAGDGVGDFYLPVETNMGRGTLMYKAPELFVNNPDSHYSFGIDMYSLGVTLWMLISRDKPFGRCSSRYQLLNAIPKGFFDCGLQVSGNATPENPSLHHSSWDLCFPSGEVAGPVVQEIISATLESDPILRWHASRLNAYIKSFVNSV